MEMHNTESNMVLMPICATLHSAALSSKCAGKYWTCWGKDDGKGEITKFINRCDEGGNEAGWTKGCCLTATPKREPNERVELGTTNIIIFG